jgi:hypothetical protein
MALRRMRALVAHRDAAHGLGRRSRDSTADPHASCADDGMRLSAGVHLSHRSGVCALEAAALTAGERPGDHPACVCPVIAAFVRGYNDVTDDARRQDLLPFVPRLVGTSSPVHAGPRLARLRRADHELTGRRRSRVGWLADGFGYDVLAVDELGRRVARQLARRPDGHHRALALIDDLIELGDQRWTRA